MLLIPRDAFVSGLRLNPELALAVGADLVGRLERSKQLANGLALAGVQERVVSRLLAIGRQDGTPGPEGLLIRNRPTQQELANQIGACRETVSRTVSDLVRKGPAHAARPVAAGQQAARRDGGLTLARPPPRHPSAGSVRSR